MKRVVLVMLALAALAALAVASYAVASGDGKRGTRALRATLNGFQETPSISTSGFGIFTARIREGQIEYRLTYFGLEANATAAHIHLAQRGVAGGVAAFLCGGGDKPPCPARSGTVTGVIDAADVVGPANQGIAQGELAELVRALRVGHTYANVHTTAFPGGEIRGQIADFDQREYLGGR